MALRSVRNVSEYLGYLFSVSFLSGIPPLMLVIVFYQQFPGSHNQKHCSFSTSAAADPELLYEIQLVSGEKAQKWGTNFLLFVFYKHILFSRVGMLLFISGGFTLFSNILRFYSCLCGESSPFGSLVVAK